MRALRTQDSSWSHLNNKSVVAPYLHALNVSLDLFLFRHIVYFFSFVCVEGLQKRKRPSDLMDRNVPKSLRIYLHIPNYWISDDPFQNLDGSIYSKIWPVSLPKSWRTFNLLLWILSTIHAHAHDDTNPCEIILTQSRFSWKDCRHDSVCILSTIFWILAAKASSFLQIQHSTSSDTMITQCVPPPWKFFN